MRGYAYQLYASALAWLELGAGQQLFLEVAKDYAIVAGDALNAVEVKDTSAARVTINSEDVRDTINAFVDLVDRNPERQVFLRFLSTSTIGQERKREHRTGKIPALYYWREAARGADVRPLRDALSKIDLNDRARAFIEARSDDEALRRDFLRHLHWDCGRPDLESVRSELEEALVRYGSERLRVPAAEGIRLTPIVLSRILTTIIQTGLRRLTDVDLLTLLEESTRVSLPRKDLDPLLRELAVPVAPDGARLAVEAGSRPQILEREDEIPLPINLATRATVIAALCGKARADSIVFVTGATGCGKTIAARLTGRALSGRWYVVDLRDATPDEIGRSLRAALGSIGRLAPAGVILDDMNEIEDGQARTALVRFVSALRRRDVFCFMTAYRPPSARAMSELGVGQEAHFAVPDLSIEEVSDLVAGAGGNAAIWGKAVHMAGAFGHPQLTQAVIFGLQARSWPKNELQELWPLIRSDDVEAERLATRQRLVAAMPEPRRLLLYRLSLLLGRFDRGLALSLGALLPAVAMPGEQLDALVGPWIDRTTRDQMRVSPLLSGAGRQILSQEEQVLINRAAAENLVSGRTIDIATADSAFLHALLGKAEKVLSAVAIGVLTAKEETRDLLAEWLTGLRLQRTDQPIYPDRSGVSLTLRLAQFLLVAERGKVALVRECWRALVAEIEAETDAKTKDRFEYLALAKALNNRSAAGMLPDWVGLLLRFNHLTSVSPERRKLMGRFGKSQRGKPSPTPLGMFFILQAFGVNSVADLAAVFDRLDQLTPKERALLFADVFQIPSDFALIVNRAWLEEHKRGKADWLACAAHYRGMADQAEAWGYRELALRCHVARGVMLDEYTHDPASALSALDEAIRRLGADPILSRARAKILYRRNDHLGALKLLRDVSQSTALDDPIERATMLREAGISAAEIGEWAEARQWFTAAHEASSKAVSPEMLPNTIGLRADAAVAAYKSGDPAGSVAGLIKSVEELAKLDPNASIKAAYCHRVVRHTALWLFGQATGEELSVHGGPTAMAPGICSNSEPQDIRDLPLGPIDLIWYLLAEAELAFGVAVGMERSLRSRLKGRAIPALDLGLRKVRLDADIRRVDAIALVAHLPGWVDAQLHLEAHKEAIMAQDVMEPVYGEIDFVTLEQLQQPSAVQAAEDLLLAFAMFAWLEQRPEALAPLAIASGSLGQYPGEKLAKALLGGDSTGGRLEDQVASQICALLGGADLDPDELFVAGLRFVQFVRQSNFKKLLTGPLVKWAKAKWAYVVREQRFLLRNPTATVDPIGEAIAAQDNSLNALGALLLSAEPAVKPQLALSFRDYLRSL